MTLTTEIITKFNETLDEHGEDVTLRHYTGMQVNNDSDYDEIYQQVNNLNTDNKVSHTYDEYTVRAFIQPYFLPQREQRLRQTVIGYEDQDKKFCYMKVKDTSGTEINSREQSPSDYNINENDEIVRNTTRYTVMQVEDWTHKGTLVYYKLTIKIEFDKKVIS